MILLNKNTTFICIRIYFFIPFLLFLFNKIDNLIKKIIFFSFYIEGLFDNYFKNNSKIVFFLEIVFNLL